MAYATSVRFLAGSLCHFAMSGRSAVLKQLSVRMPGARLSAGDVGVR